MIKQLSKVGNSSALILDKTLMELCHLDPQGSVEIEVEHGALVIRAASNAARDRTLAEASSALIDEFADTYKKLAE